MKIKEWMQRILWFVCGVVVAGVLFMAPSSITKATAGGIADVIQQLAARITALETERVQKLEEKVAVMDLKLKAMENYKPPACYQTKESKNEGPNDFKDRP